MLCIPPYILVRRNNDMIEMIRRNNDMIEYMCIYVLHLDVAHLNEPRNIPSSEFVYASDAQKLDEPTSVSLHQFPEKATGYLQNRLNAYHAHIISHKP